MEPRVPPHGTPAAPAVGSGARSGPVLLGALVALVLPVAWALGVGPAWLQPRLGGVAYALVGMVVLWGCALGTLAAVRYGEGRPLASIGLRRPTLRGALLAVGIGVGLSLLVPALTLLAAAVLPSPAEGGVLDVAERFPAWLLGLGVVTAAVTEEILFRAWPIDRLGGRGRLPWAGMLLGLAAFVLMHAQGWNAAHVVGVVLPLGIALTALYAWRREAWFVMIVHLMVDLPLVLLAAMQG